MNGSFVMELEEPNTESVDEIPSINDEFGLDGVGEAEVEFDGRDLLSVTTIVYLNAFALMVSSGKRFKDFAILVKTLQKPDVIIVTDIGGYSGVAEIRSMMKGLLSPYGAAYSQKLLGYGKRQAGAGIMLLYKREKFRCGDLPLHRISPRKYC